jgi:2-alkenal reductase
MRKSFSLVFILSLLIAVVVAGCGVLPQEATTLPVAGESISFSLDQIPAADTAAVQPAADIVAAPAVAPAASAAIASQEDVFINLYQQVNPAVVSVNLTQGGGSGFVVDPDGYIVTNNHVVEQGGPILVRFSNGDSRQAEVVGTDPQGDIALLKVDAAPGELTALTLGDSDALQVGQIVVAIGSPFGLESTMTTGIVSGLSRALPSDGLSTGPNYQVPDVIQTDAAINPGNSGGPLLNLQGEVIGINTAIESPVRANSGVGFAVPSNVVSVVIDQLRDNGQVAYPWLGIAGGTLTPEGAEQLGLPRDLRGVIISNVTAGGPADQAGVRGIDPNTNAGGDVITAINGVPVVEFDDLLGYIVTETRVGQTVELTISRDGQPLTLSLTLSARPTEPTG